MKMYPFEHGALRLSFVNSNFLKVYQILSCLSLKGVERLNVRLVLLALASTDFGLFKQILNSVQNDVPATERDMATRSQKTLGMYRACDVLRFSQKRRQARISMSILVDYS